ncbi:hypothetical protein L1887_62748 [Cichorium endivia]|nr:hypothetical protein L1887_62748 [Cichorium endivia]
MACEKQPEGRSSSDPSNLRLWQRPPRERGVTLSSRPTAATLTSSRFGILPPSCHPHTSRTIVTMPVGSIPAITGKLRKRLILDLTVALGGWHCPRLRILVRRSRALGRPPRCLLRKAPVRALRVNSHHPNERWHSSRIAHSAVNLVAIDSIPPATTTGVHGPLTDDAKTSE